MKRLVVDLDDTICRTHDGDYENSAPRWQIIDRLREYQSDGFEIVIATSRNVRTFNGNIGKINAVTLPRIVEWLNRHEVPYDEIIVGKPWCGSDGFYVDDRAVRPSEFISMTNEELRSLVEREK